LEKKLNFENINENDEITPLKITMDKNNYKLYNRLITEINPLHFNKNYAKSLGFKDIVIAGLYTYSFFPKMLVDWTNDPNCLKKIEIRFRKPAYPEDVITHRGLIKKKYIINNEKLVDCEIWAENQNGEKLTTAIATLSFQ